MARGSERETPAQQTRANAARDGKCNSEGAVRKGRRIARRYQSAQSQRANGRETEKLNLRWQDHWWVGKPQVGLRRQSEATTALFPRANVFAERKTVWRCASHRTPKKRGLIASD